LDIQGQNLRDAMGKRRRILIIDDNEHIVAAL